MEKIERLNKRIKCLEEDNIQLRTEFAEILHNKTAKICALRAEKTELEAQVLYWAESSVADLVKEATTRCAEIARNSCLSPPDGGSPTPEEIACAEYAAQLIEKEYDLE